MLELRPCIRAVAAMTALALATGCGNEEEGPATDSIVPAGYVVYAPSQARITAEDHTPGFFRDLYRFLGAQSALDDLTATERMLLDLPERIHNRDEMDFLPEIASETLNALLILTLRAVQANSDRPGVANRMGSALLGTVLALDPARERWNANHTPLEAVEFHEGGPDVVATAALQVMDQAALGEPVSCKVAAARTGDYAGWNRNDGEAFWVEGICYPGVPGYCESDIYHDPTCYDYWVPERCTGGYWRDRGYYELRCVDDDDCREEYICYDYDDCRYVWRCTEGERCENVWVDRDEYVHGVCDGGYYEEECYGAYWERGICYEGREKWCENGHYEFRFPGGTWTFSAFLKAPEGCALARQPQTSLSTTAMALIYDSEPLFRLVPGEWKSASTALLDQDAFYDVEPHEGVFDGSLQILRQLAISNNVDVIIQDDPQ